MRIACVLAATFFSATAVAAPPRSLESLRDEARALNLVQSVLGWYTRTEGEPSIAAETYKGHETLFSKASIAQVAQAAKRAKSDDERRALEFFKSYLASEFLSLHVAHFDDDVENAELHAQVKLPWLPSPTPYKQLEILSNEEKDAAHRATIEKERAQIWRSTLNPILEMKEREAQRLAKELGYRSYVALAEEFRRVDVRPLIAEGARFFAASDARYRELLAEVAQRQLGMKVSELHRSDIGRLRKAPRFQKFFPRDLMLPAFRHFLAGIGLDEKTVAGTTIRVDDALNPQKEPRAACYSIRVPEDIRISVKPTGGIDDFVTFFHEGGHALHYARTTSKVWEFQQLGPYALTEGLAETFGHVWDDPAWLVRYRKFVDEWNRAHKTNVPLMSDADIGELVRARVFEEIYFLRRYAAAKLPYELALHGGAEPAVAPEALQALYRDLFSRAYGFALTDEDALRFRTDVDDLFYAADYTRAFALANLIHEALRKKVGADWLEKKEAGALLNEIFADGNRLQPDEVARRFGYDRLDLRPSEARFDRLLSKP